MNTVNTCCNEQKFFESHTKIRHFEKGAVYQILTDGLNQVLIRMCLSLLSSFLFLYVQKHLPRLSSCGYFAYFCFSAGSGLWIGLLRSPNLVAILRFDSLIYFPLEQHNPWQTLQAGKMSLSFSENKLFTFFVTF